VIATRVIATKATATKTATACIVVVAATVVVVTARTGLTTAVAISKARPGNRLKTKAVVTSHVSLSKPTTAACFRASENLNGLQN
jgi:short subunit fatty acids transporter